MSEDIRYHLGEKWKRTNRCGELSGGSAGETVTLAGWVKKVRELGGLTFVDLWDRTGVAQLVTEQESSELHGILGSLRAEDVIAVIGRVRQRPEEMRNPRMKTGEIEVVVDDVLVLNKSVVPPFNVVSEVQASDDLRLRYRYLDLRRDPLQSNIELRHRLSQSTRKFLSSSGFLEIETPMLVRRTPEGARDYLVPSRLQPGKFYALPQSPQLYKQILMVSGFDRYFQLARCLRDEDLRADRQPEHTQIDIEMSFIDEEDVFEITEKLMTAIFSQTIGAGLAPPFERMTYDEAMLRYGTDKPDLRFGLEIRDCGEVFLRSEFKIFRSVLEEGGVVRGISFPEGFEFSRSRIGELEKLVKNAGAGGLAAIKVENGGLSSPFSKFLTGEQAARLIEIFGIGDRSLVLLVGGEEGVAAAALGELRLHIGRSHCHVDDNDFKFVWINRFPLFIASGEGGWEPAHHIFSMPLEEDLPHIDSDPGKVRGHLYDLVCNGTELGSGSIRVHHRGLQERLFAVIGIDHESAERKFGFLLEAFEHGAPPHGGIALGLDRIAMIMGGGNSIRDYIAFPKTQSAASLMEGAPSDVEPELLEELHIQAIKRQNKE